MWSPFCNPFVFTFMHVMGGVPPSSTFGRSNPQIEAHLQLWSGDPDPGATFRRVPIYPLCFQILAHSFALFCTLQKLNSFLFKRFRTLCQKYRGWGYPPSLEEEQNETTDCQFLV